MKSNEGWNIFLTSAWLVDRYFQIFTVYLLVVKFKIFPDFTMIHSVQYYSRLVTNVRKWCLVRDIRTILYLHTYSHTPAHAIDSFSNNFLHYLKSNWVKRIFSSNIWINPTSWWFDDSWSFSWRKIQHQAEEPFIQILLLGLFYYGTSTVVHIPW